VGRRKLVLLKSKRPTDLGSPLGPSWIDSCTGSEYSEVRGKDGVVRIKQENKDGSVICWEPLKALQVDPYTGTKFRLFQAKNGMVLVQQKNEDGSVFYWEKMRDSSIVFLRKRSKTHRFRTEKDSCKTRNGRKS
jgi:hypothetical protein